MAQAAPAANSCIAGLPPDLSSQFEPLLQALCEANQSGLKSTNQQDLELIAEAMALLALADPGYGYGFPPPSYSTRPPALAPATEPAAMPPIPQAEDGQATPQTDEAPVHQSADDTPAEPPPDEVPACGSSPP